MLARDLQLPSNIEGINASWILSKEFYGYIDENAKIIKKPKNKISSTLSVKLQMQKPKKL